MARTQAQAQDESVEVPRRLRSVEEHPEDHLPKGFGGVADIASLLAPVYRGEQLLALGQYKEAEAAFRSSNGYGLVGLGDALMAQRRFAGALEAYNASLHGTPPETDRVMALRYAVALYAVGQPAKARALYAGGVSNLPRSVTVGDELLPSLIAPRSTNLKEFAEITYTAVAYAYLLSEGIDKKNKALTAARLTLRTDSDNLLAQCAEAVALLDILPDEGLKRLDLLTKSPDTKVPKLLKRQIKDKWEVFRLQAERVKRRQQAKTLPKP